MEKLKSLVVLFIIITAIIPLYSLIKYLQKIIRPRESLGRLFLFILANLVVIFASVFLMVFIIKKLFVPAS